jgi:hypothetical protein
LWQNLAIFKKSLVSGYCISPQKREILIEYSFSKVFFAKWRKSNTKKKFNDVPMDDRHFGYITKMENKKHTGRCFFSGELIFTILRKEFSENILSQIPFLKTKIAKKKPNDKKRRPESPQLLPI